MPELTIQQAYELAVRHHQAGRLGEAEQVYRQILAVQPKHAEALHMLGVLAHQTGRNEVAVELIRQAVAVNPNHFEACYNLGVTLAAAGLLDEAIDAYRRAVALNPGHAVAHNNLGSALKDKGRFDEAIASYRQAIALNPQYAEAHNNLGNALRDQGQPDGAIAAYRRAIGLRPAFFEAYNNLASALNDRGQLDEAAAAYRQAIALDPGSADAHSNLGSTLGDLGRMDEAIAELQRAIALKPDAVEAHSKLVYAMSYSARCDTGYILREAREWNRRHAAPLKVLVGPHHNTPDPGRRLRIGYVSPDLRDHCVSFFTLPLFSHHDRQHFEIFCYAHVLRPDEITRRHQECVDHWRATLGQSDEQIAELIRRDQIDILVDLTMHMARNRLLVFARKPAPVQVAWLAYPGTTGLEAIDYRITDPYLDPPGTSDDFYAEKSIRLPETFWCYDPLTREPGVNTLPALSSGVITFGSLNNYRKVNDPLLALWAEVLGAVDGSRLMLLSPKGEHRRRVEEFFGTREVNPSRIVWFDRAPRRNYLAAYHAIDIGLDTLFPYNGHTTSLDSFWMGVPVVTLAGQSVVGRGGVSQLMNLGLPELVARTREEFVAIAAGLAGDLPRLAELRRTLRPRMEASALMDAARFTRNMEGAYREMWRSWCARKAGNA